MIRGREKSLETIRVVDLDKETVCYCEGSEILLIRRYLFLCENVLSQLFEERRESAKVCS